MNKIQFDRLLKPLIKIYDDIELELIKNILERLENYNSVQGSLKWYLEKLMDLGKLDKDNLKILKDHKEQIELAMTEIATFCGYNIDNLEQFNEYYENGLIKVNPSTLNQSIAITNLISEALKDTDDIMNLINTKALEGAKESYKNILNKTYVETASGIYTYTESIRNALKDFSKEGIQTVHYRGGKTLSIESVVRRDVITRMNKLVGDVEIQHAKELDTNLVYVDQHLGARVRTKYMKHNYEAHAEWQGKKYMIDGSSDEYPNLYDSTGYGEMLGLKGINCYHNMCPTWEWEKIPNRIDEIENAKVYEQLQQQRKYERKLRQLKRERLIAKESKNIDDYKQANDRFKETSQEFNNWLEQNNLTRNYNREYVADNIQKKEKIESNYRDVTQEWLDKATPNSHEVKDRNYFEYKNVKYGVDDQNVVFDYSKKEKEVAEWLENTFGGEIYMNPRINYPKGIETADYLWNSELWDLKEVANASSEIRAIDNAIKNHEGQSNNFIIDITGCKLSNEIIMKQVQNVFIPTNKFYRDWVNKIIIKREKELLKIYIKK